MISNAKQTLIATSIIANPSDLQPQLLERPSKISQHLQQTKIQLSYYSATRSLSSGLFGNVFSDEPNLAFSILKCLNNCDPSVAIKISQNIIISGGIASTKGFYERLRQEINDQLQNNTEVQKSKYLKNYISFTKTNYPSSCLPWIGASIVSQLNPSERYCITQEKFRQNGQVLPDSFADDYLFMFKLNEKDIEGTNDGEDII